MFSGVWDFFSTTTCLNGLKLGQSLFRCYMCSQSRVQSTGVAATMPHYKVELLAKCGSTKARISDYVRPFPVGRSWKVAC